MQSATCFQIAKDARENLTALENHTMGEPLNLPLDDEEILR
jgi:hypothetical protein